MKCDKETIGRVLIACMMLGFYQTIRRENVSRMGTPKVTYIQEREFGTVLLIHTNRRCKI